MKTTLSNHHLLSLEFLVGERNNSGQVYEGVLGPGGPVEGKTIFHWGVGDQWLQYNSHLTLPSVGDYVVHGGFNYHSQTSTYQAFAVNSLSLLMIYQGMWQNDEMLVFSLVNPDAKGSSRIVYIKKPGGSIQMRSESLTADGDFQVYFETLMTREV